MENIMVRSVSSGIYAPLLVKANGVYAPKLFPSVVVIIISKWVIPSTLEWKSFALKPCLEALYKGVA